MSPSAFSNLPLQKNPLRPPMFWVNALFLLPSGCQPVSLHLSSSLFLLPLRIDHIWLAPLPFLLFFSGRLSCLSPTRRLPCRSFIWAKNRRTGWIKPQLNESSDSKYQWTEAHWKYKHGSCSVCRLTFCLLKNCRELLDGKEKKNRSRRTVVSDW